jgi:hypothetical protein
MTALHLLTPPAVYRHRPTEVEAMQFTHATRKSLEAWLAAGLGRDRFEMTPSHLVIETAQGDSRDCGLGCWVIRRRTRDGFEFYPVDHEVIADAYDLAEVPA